MGFTASIRTTFPFDVARRDIPLGRVDRGPRVGLTEDGLLLVVCFVCVVIFVLAVVDLRLYRRCWCLLDMPLR